MELSINKITKHIVNNFPAVLLAILIAWCILLQVQVCAQKGYIKTLAEAGSLQAQGGIILLKELEVHIKQEEHNGETEYQ